MGGRRTTVRAGDADYESIGAGYARYRRPDARIQAAIDSALGDADSVLNVGAGAGSYEPTDRRVTAVEPSPAMRAQRPPRLAPAIAASAGDLPFADDSFDAAMAILTVHQWPDPVAGLREMRRVTRGRVVVMTCDLERLRTFWLYDYVPELFGVEAARFPSLETLTRAFDGDVALLRPPIPIDCTDGFLEAYYGRPEAFLDPAARRACSSWSFVQEAVVERLERMLAAELAGGEWDRRFGGLRAQPSYGGSIVLIIAGAEPARGLHRYPSAAHRLDGEDG